MSEIDVICNGFAKLDDSLMSKRPPKIKWGLEFQAWSLEKQNIYLKKLSASMNHAADLVQTERNALLLKVDTQDAIIVSLQTQAKQAQDSMQNVLIQTNDERQSFNKKVVELQDKLRLLEQEYA